MTKLVYKTEVFVERGRYVALCSSLGVSGFGETQEEATGSLQEAVEAFLMECEAEGTLDEVLEESGFEKRGDAWKLRPRVIEDRVALIGPGEDATSIGPNAEKPDSTNRPRSRHPIEATRLSKEDIEQKLAAFEMRFGMTSREFIARYNRCEFEEEKTEFLDWTWYYDVAADCGVVSTSLET